MCPSLDIAMGQGTMLMPNYSYMLSVLMGVVLLFVTLHLAFHSDVHGMIQVNIIHKNKCHENFQGIFTCGQYNLKIP